MVEKDDLPLSRADGIAYYSTEIGQDSRDVRIVGFPLFLEFTNARAAYLTFIDVRILDVRGNTIFRARSTGPWFFIDLPPGSYRVRAKVEGGSGREEGLFLPGGATRRLLMVLPSD